MKLALKLLTLFVAVTLSLSMGCTSDNASFSDPDNTIDPNEDIAPAGSGYLSFEKFNVTVEVEVENLTSQDAEVTKTRATSVDPSSYIVKIISDDEDAEVVYQDTYAKTIALSDPLVLSARAYYVYVMSCEDEDIALADWSCPEYKGSGRYVVGDDAVTEVDDITCTLSNIMTTVSIAADLVDKFDSSDSEKLHVIVEVTNDLSTSSSDAVGSLTYYAEDSAKEGYMRAPSDETMKVYLVGRYNISDDEDNPLYLDIEKGDWVQSITGVKAGQYRDISVQVYYNPSGSTEIRLEITTWVYDEEIDVNITDTKFLGSVLVEPEILDPDDETTVADSPVVTLYGDLSVDDTYQITSSIFDEMFDTYSPSYMAYITPTTGSTVESISLIISSTNSYLETQLKSYGFDDDVTMEIYDNGATTAAATALSNYFSISTDASTGVVMGAVKYSGMYGLYGYDGTHTIKVVATDSQGRRSYTSLMFETTNDSSSGEGPSIVWSGGYDFETRYELYTDAANPEVNLVITPIAPSKLTSLELTISSPALSAELLEAVGLSETMDLVNADETLQGGLGALGLPYGSAITTVSELEMSISSFLISMLVGACEDVFNYPDNYSFDKNVLGYDPYEAGYIDSDFVIKAGSSNNTTTKSVMFRYTKGN